MERNIVSPTSIWGKWWEPIRKWFYPTWLGYETSTRFYDYGQSVYNYLLAQQDQVVPDIGAVGARAMALSLSVATFTICSVFLSVPACFILYKFFEVPNLTSTPVESKLKTIF
ncbi:hypothetical protein [Echinicola vietnamensis]|uniref:Uncharacterized protein n=1 Tax=Echinicola vietnamensis (strain DSM 17526 / LMG 23754 / KMM 6221) TaxID=926556 RepID=L0FVJ1_ECHVK|nr:hypothetical protein [Echinicola vietnamensis]AGA77018.1 hypothetical protein Echvi_0742 [Echinicola vietnamensis DSM 17526]